MDAQAKRKTEPLHRVLRGDVPRLVKSLEAQEPEALCVLSVTVTLLDWWEKNPAYRCTILAPEGGEDLGACVLVMEEYERKRVLLYAPEKEKTHFVKCLEETKLIPWDSVTTVARLIKPLRESVDKILEAKGYKLYAGSWIYVMMMSPNDVLALKDPELPNNIFLRELTEDDSVTLAKKWKHAQVDGLPLTKDGLKYNGGIGAVDKGGDLIGWITWNRWGGLGQLFVFPSHRRLGLGRILTIRMSKQIAKKGRTVTAEVEPDNEASHNLFLSLGFHCGFEDCYRAISHK